MSDTTTIIRIGRVKQAAMDAEDRVHRARQTVRTFQGNCSLTADRLVAEQYESLRRTLPNLHTLLPVVAWFFLDGKAPVTGAPASGTTTQIDPQGLVLNVRLPEPAWVTALLTGKMLVRMGITLSQGRGRIVATGQVGWMEAHRPQDPMRLGLYFTEITGFDRDRILRLLRDDKAAVPKSMSQNA
ncbi:MAG: hypothetical protein KIS92_20995 [Planctomycetota bacterium]|nr:hypothetical protein [Planctomycetota bacterium]